MQYLMLIYEDEKARARKSPADVERIMGEWWAYDDALRKAGVHRAGDALRPTDTATTVRVRDGKTLQTDGPFAETKEQLGG
ncbi:MAG TPA: YciI family protein, partial [Anaeromyxobacteraceae bacterium]|nr:YciI family protein [Anaeromyxobacteraceae bacterium]